MVRNFFKEPQKKEINDGETWMWKRNMNIGTWNVRSLFWSGAFQETQLESGIQKCNNFTFLIADQRAKNMNMDADFT
jgi:hypothetical protein